ncbi:hypothetical protein SZ63_07165 [Methanoculleus sediminis]|uniref:Uncharacterized protein n=1 Tax=Methanoculleus sediminis TaxID=1550566 RepID=A0A0H1R7Y1_9EURY|nr:hypothetical protein [Methanoculleus sediminis]KLK88752.1 hypothetical protein SZ63_07165 [Methanoculleus sediminis]
MNQTHIGTIALTFCIAFFAGAFFTAVLVHNPEPPAPTLRQNIYGLPLSEMWAIVQDRTGVENSTAILGDFRLVIDGDGAVEQLSFEFYGDDTGLPHWYRVAASSTGRVTWNSLEVDRAPPGEHPLTLFTEIERIPYRELAGENGILIVGVSSQSGNLSYDASYGDLYALRQSEIIPLKHVGFNTMEPWYSIDVSHGVKDGSGLVGTYYCTIFTLRDLVKAERVYYPDGRFFWPPPGSLPAGIDGSPGLGAAS